MTRLSASPNRSRSKGARCPLGSKGSGEPVVFIQGVERNVAVIKNRG
jgi:hypothetical protein